MTRERHEASHVFDRQTMATALTLARRGLGQTAPNPSVGAVIADEATGQIIARGWTQPGGRPHAETEALGRAGEQARGKTLYATLEPCSHHGGTAPCAEAIVAAGIARAVVAVEDPDSRVAGRGLERLRQAGLAVECGLMGESARWIALGHILRVTERRPFVQLKMALAADGTVPRGHAGKPTWVTGEEARACGHLLRAEADAVLVGRQTVIDDDPLLTCRLPGLEHRSPIRIVLSKRGGGLAPSRLAKTAATVPVWLFCEPHTKAADLEKRGIRLFQAPFADEGLPLRSVLEAIATEGLTRLLVEGGPVTWRAFWQSGFADEIIVFQANTSARTARKADAFSAPARILTNTHEEQGITPHDQRQLGDTGMFVFRRKV